MYYNFFAVSHKYIYWMRVELVCKGCCQSKQRKVGWEDQVKICRDFSSLCTDLCTLLVKQYRPKSVFVCGVNPEMLGKGHQEVLGGESVK